MDLSLILRRTIVVISQNILINCLIKPHFIRLLMTYVFNISIVDFGLYFGIEVTYKTMDSRVYLRL